MATSGGHDHPACAAPGARARRSGPAALTDLVSASALGLPEVSRVRCLRDSIPRMSDVDHDRLYQLSESQAGYFTTSQAQDAGMDRTTLRYHARPGGRYQRVRQGLYRLRHFPTSPCHKAPPPRHVTWPADSSTAGNPIRADQDLRGAGSIPDFKRECRGRPSHHGVAGIPPP
jgi:hypothetical protein